MRTLILVLLMTGISWADQIPAPPPNFDEPVSAQEYLRKIYDNWQILETVTTGPHGSKTGDRGQKVFFDTTTDKICINVDGASQWLCADLTAP